MTEKVTNNKLDPKKVYRNGEAYKIPPGETKEIPEEGETTETEDSKSTTNEEEGE